MLTKTLNFDNDVLAVLRSMKFSDDGKLGVITGGQLSRDLYTRANKALEIMGGKWNRKTGGHVFESDPRGQVEGLLETGMLSVERDGFFETPRAVVERMLELVPIQYGDFILEPSAGLGAIARIIKEAGKDDLITIWCVEKNSDRALKLRDWFGNVFCCDFLQWNTTEVFDRIYMNPPFEESQDIDHVMRAYELLDIEGGASMVSVMGEGAFFRGDKKAVAFREWLSSVGGYSEKLPEGSFNESGTGVNTRLVWIKR